MKCLRLSPLVGLSALLIAQAAAMPRAQATEPTPATEDVAMKLEFHPIRASAASKRSGDSLKPNVDSAEFLPIDAELRMHVHADGTLSYECNEDHTAGKKTATQPESGS